MIVALMHRDTVPATAASGVAKPDGPYDRWAFTGLGGLHDRWALTGLGGPHDRWAFTEPRCRA